MSLRVNLIDDPDRTRMLDQLLTVQDKDTSHSEKTVKSIMNYIISYFVETTIVLDITGCQPLHAPVGLLYKLDRSSMSMKSYTASASTQTLHRNNGLETPLISVYANKLLQDAIRFTDQQCSIIQHLAYRIKEEIEAAILSSLYYSAHIGETLTSVELLTDRILEATNNIGRRFGVPGNFIVVDNYMVPHIMRSPLFVPTPNALSQIGALGPIKVYLHRHADGSPLRDSILVGYKQSAADAGAFFLPFKFIPPNMSSMSMEINWREMLFRYDTDFSQVEKSFELIPVKIACK